MSQATLSLNIDNTLKENWFKVCDELGVNISTVVTMLAKKMSREKRIPFEVSEVIPTAIGGMSKKELDAELTKGIESLNSDRAYTQNEVDSELARDFGI